MGFVAVTFSAAAAAPETGTPPSPRISMLRRSPWPRRKPQRAGAGVGHPSRGHGLEAVGEPAGGVDDDVDGAAGAEHGDPPAGSEPDQRHVRDHLARQEVDGGGAGPARTGREDAEEARGRRAHDGDVERDGDGAVRDPGPTADRDLRLSPDAQCGPLACDAGVEQPRRRDRAEAVGEPARHVDHDVGGARQLRIET